MSGHTNDRFLRRVLVIGALGASSALCLLLLFARATRTGQPSHRFLVWNLFLAWIPVIFALAVDHAETRAHGRLVALSAAVGWLLFFPNAPYLITDLIHLEHQPPVPLWYDALTYAAFGWTGVLCGFVSLAFVQGVVARRFGGRAGWAVACAALALGGFGVYLGRFLRWNSWDIVREPRRLGGQIRDRVLDPWSHPKTVAVTVLFSAFLGVTYLVFCAFARLWNEQGTARPGI